MHGEDEKMTVANESDTESPRDDGGGHNACYDIGGGVRFEM